ncbi:MAG: hypothetical protein ACK5BE_07055 [Alphaproteobacteria bacterium]|jgi:hypothetical protein
MSIFDSVADGLNSFVNAGGSVINNATNQIADVFNSFDNFKQTKQYEATQKNPAVQSQQLISGDGLNIKTIAVYGGIAVATVLLIIILTKK